MHPPAITARKAVAGACALGLMGVLLAGTAIALPVAAYGSQVDPSAAPSASADAVAAIEVEPELPAEQASSPLPSAAPSVEPAIKAEAEPSPEPSSDALAEPESTPEPEPTTLDVSPVAEAASAVPSPRSTGDPDDAGTFTGEDGCTYLFSPHDTGIVIDDIDDCTVVSVPSSIDGEAVTVVGDGDRMSGASTFTSVSIPGSVTTIATDAFIDAPRLAVLHLSEGLTHIGPAAFRAAASLTELTLPDSVTSVGAYTFANAGSLERLDLGSLVRADVLAFSGAGKVTSLTVPATLEHAEDTAFGNMRALRYLLIEGSTNGLVKHTFVNSTALEEVEFRERHSRAVITGTVFQNAAPATAYFHDGAFGLSCAGDMATIGGTAMETQCLVDLTFDRGATSTSFENDVREGTVITEGPQTVAPIGLEFKGWLPTLPHTVEADTLFVAQFGAPEPVGYTPSEDDLVEGAQGGFLIPESVTAGDQLTLTPPSEPNPGGTSAPGEPEEIENPNDLIDVWMFSEPVELEIVSASDSEIVVQVPAAMEPGAHRVAVYSVEGDLLGWQPVTVLAAEAPDGGDTDGGSGADGESGTGDEGAGSSTGGEDNSGGSEATGSDAQADGNPTAELAMTGAPSIALMLAGALVLASAGALLVARRRA